MSGNNGVENGGVVEEIESDGDEVVILVDEAGKEHQFMVSAVLGGGHWVAWLLVRV